MIEKETDQFVSFSLCCRQQTPKRDGSPFLCLSDFIRPLSSGIPDTIGAFASCIDADMEGLYEQDPYKHLLVQTLSDRLAEAATEKMHEYVRKEAWGYAKDENLGNSAIYWSRNIKGFALPSVTRLYRINPSTSCWMNCWT